eukprot:9681363-Alexandrium_andersonii.AAC.1
MLSVPEELPGRETDASDTMSQVSYTPLQSDYTSGDEAGARLGSEVTSLDEGSSDDAAESVKTDPYGEEAEVALFGAAETFSLTRVPKVELDQSAERDRMLAALQKGDEVSMSALAAEAYLDGARIKEEDDLEVA